MYAIRSYYDKFLFLTHDAEDRLKSDGLPDIFSGHHAGYLKRIDDMIRSGLIQFLDVFFTIGACNDSYLGIELATGQCDVDVGHIVPGRTQHGRGDRAPAAPAQPRRDP